MSLIAYSSPYIAGLWSCPSSLKWRPNVSFPNYQPHFLFINEYVSSICTSLNTHLNTCTLNCAQAFCRPQNGQTTTAGLLTRMLVTIIFRVTFPFLPTNGRREDGTLRAFYVVLKMDCRTALSTECYIEHFSVNCRYRYASGIAWSQWIPRASCQRPWGVRVGLLLVLD